eukprot:TRINITY_DN98674_c0_g1_i1.p1 TRINITY_DN98674_c0_g1~~TRINITY_DN98674_c0_g1_i1.p1  ORF type:complete len:264 (+),score=68.57 TRINITY_DN98674_c0_g1_i1:37-828(+)
MPRGPKKHLKRLNAPNHWMLDKLSGAFAPKPSAGPHKTRECLPLIIIMRNRLRYALTYRECLMILKQEHVLVDQKVRTDVTFPAGFMDVITIPETQENFRLLYDVKGRFNIHKINEEEAKYKLLKVTKVAVGKKGVPYIVTHDGRTIRYPNPDINASDTIKYNFEDGSIDEIVPMEVGNLCMITGGRNLGRIGVIERKEKHPGSHQIVHVKDSIGNQFATRISNIFIIGKGHNSIVSIPKNKGIKLTVIEEHKRKQKKLQQQK